MAASLKLLATSASKDSAVDEWGSASLLQPAASDLVLELYDRERPALERYLRAIGTDAEAARDIVHEAFLKLHEHLLADGDRTNLRAWLYRVAHNQAENRRRSAAVSRGEDLAALMNAAEPAETSPSPEQLLLCREREQRIRAAICRLTALQQNCLTLRAQGFRYREIAEILQLSTSTVGDIIQRAILKVREIL
jgi:RNA polymerase sigma-70 factor (ECF subfamily)